MLKIHKVNGNGNCLFNAVAFGILYRKLKPKKPTSKQVNLLARLLRKQMVIEMYSYILNNNPSSDIVHTMSGSYNNFNEVDFDNLPIRKQLILKSIKYIEHISKDGCWGGAIEVFFLNRIIIRDYKFKGIKVYNPDTGKLFPGFEQNLSNLYNTPLRIVHHTGQHYDYAEFVYKKASIPIVNGPFMK